MGVLEGNWKRLKKTATLHSNDILFSAFRLTFKPDTYKYGHAVLLDVVG
jgi:hypothetical protein